MSSVATDADRRAELNAAEPIRTELECRLSDAVGEAQRRAQKADADRVQQSCAHLWEVAELDRKVEAAESRAKDAEHRVNAAEREVHMFEAAYGNCQMELAAARGQHNPEVAALADGLMRALGVDSASELHRELGKVLRARTVSGG